ncbi:Tetratricopeptide repeat-containing protein [Hyunsoonleella jejuensis]|uniref:Tetratricopeptide repeat-containing protein n=1 Tax=Hyunsoonleella jejuensis TaxID=419940 RepID=A0A1H9CYW2_9FLAO|nr:tetratricopeptide repeat protein [Hyunsoonleella jejuensis]SEQ06400.1 Tetratricopeptide repeat-containing protein [Hyunsoonleella jejuensis]
MKKILLVFLFVPLLSMGQATKFVRQALKLNDPEAQIEMLNQALDIDSKHLDALFYRGIAKYNLADYEGAILDFTKIIFYEPDADSYYNRGNCKFNLEDYEGALFDYEKAVELDPDLIGAYFNLGNAKFAQEDYSGAVEAFTKVIRFFPNDYKSYSQRALAYMELNKYRLAFDDFGACILIRPDSESYYNRGYALLEINYYKEAKDDFLKAIERNPDNTPAYFYLGVSQFLLSDFLSAIKSLSFATNKDQMDYDAYFGLAMAYYYLNDFDKAKEKFERAKKILDPSSNNDDISTFEDTYWEVNEKPLFTEMNQRLSKL